MVSLRAFPAPSKVSSLGLEKEPSTAPESLEVLVLCTYGWTYSLCQAKQATRPHMYVKGIRIKLSTLHPAGTTSIYYASTPTTIMSHTIKRVGEVQESHGGHHEDWNGVDTVCKGAAYNSLLNRLKAEPDTAYVDINGLTANVKDHGNSKVWQGFEKWEKTYEHGHHDRNHWTGTRRFEYIALIEVTPSKLRAPSSTAKI
ncbi:hypothetical protein QFC22_006104 [Naganishia vaughanmartiniae]|uniref:Uncharacterized protein n=1 Tax=Naganishia vaughanmartiniae TaxID=1424756 RepID=A0ACC2WNG8_9TREE|nr:hypothetical protein QFC22_006104 [Naganishia vaughanmartiniae]